MVENSLGQVIHQRNVTQQEMSKQIQTKLLLRCAYRALLHFGKNKKKEGECFALRTCRCMHMVNGKSIFSTAFFLTQSSSFIIIHRHSSSLHTVQKIQTHIRRSSTLTCVLVLYAHVPPTSTPLHSVRLALADVSCIYRVWGC